MTEWCFQIDSERSPSCLGSSLWGLGYERRGNQGCGFVREFFFSEYGFRECMDCETGRGGKLGFCGVRF